VKHFQLTHFCDITRKSCDSERLSNNLILQIPRRLTNLTNWSKRLAVNKCTNCTLPHIAYLITTAVTVPANTVTVMHQGRFSLDSAINFNRDYVDLEKLITSKIEKDLKLNDENHNVMIIRKAMIDAINEDAAIDEEAVMKKELLKLACISDIALDLHCDSEALLYMFTHDLLWPQLSDLAAEIGSEVQLLSGLSGGNPFDEALSCPWQTLKEKFKDYPIPMACQSATIELRGEKDVCHEFAKKDSIAFYRFLQRRGYIAGGNNLSIPLPNLIRDASPLTGVEMIFCNKPGIVCLNVKIGDIVNEGDVLGEVIDIENPYAPTQELKCRTSGIIFSIFNHKLCKPGTFILKVAGEKPLPWRKGKLLTL